MPAKSEGVINFYSFWWLELNNEFQILNVYITKNYLLLYKVYFYGDT